MKCKDCKYWTVRKDAVNYGDCLNEKFRYIGSDSNAHAYENDMLLYVDVECYKASVFVGKDFGCIHFSQKGNKVSFTGSMKVFKK